MSYSTNVVVPIDADITAHARVTLFPQPYGIEGRGDPPDVDWLSVRHAGESFDVEGRGSSVVLWRQVGHGLSERHTIDLDNYLEAAVELAKEETGDDE